MAPRRNTRSGTLPHVHAAGRGIVIQIQGDGEGARKALEMVRENLRETGTEAERTARAVQQSFDRMNASIRFRQTARSADGLAQSVDRVSDSIGHTVPATAAASAGLRALEGNFTNNIRAGERFLTLLPGMQSLLQVAFPFIGAAVLGTALFEMGEKAYHAYQNLVLLKGQLQQIDALNIEAGKKMEQAADARQSATEAMLRATKGERAALESHLAYQSGKGIDLSETFRDPNFATLGDNLKSNYETLYKNIAPADVPDRIAKITSEMGKLKSALDQVKKGGDASAFAGGMGPVDGGSTGYDTPTVGGFGPGPLQDAKKYFEARIGALTALKNNLEAASTTRQARITSTQASLITARAPQQLEGTNPISVARAGLSEEQAKAVAASQRQQNQIMLAEWDAQHKMALESEQAFLAKKLQLLTAELDAEQDGLRKQAATLQGLYERQRGDRSLKRNSNGETAEELKTQTELLRIKVAIGEIDVKRAQATSQNNAEVFAAQQKSEIEGLRLAADLETQRNSGISARLALVQRETQMRIQETTLNGSPADVANAQAAGAVAEQKLRIAEVTRQITEEENKYKLAVEDVKDREEKGRLSKRQAAQETNALNQKELATLRELVQTYDVLAANLGGEYVQKAQELGEELNKLSRPDRSKDFGADLSKGMQSMVESIAESATEGKESFSKMAESILRDIDRIGLKMVAKKFIEPLFENAFNGGGGLAGIFGRGGGGAGAAASAGSDVAGMMIPLAVPPAYKPTSRPFPGGGGAGGAGGIFSTIAQGAAKAAMPSMTHNIINQSSNPVTSDEPQLVYDEETRELIINTILHDHATGGPVSQLGGNG